MADGSALWFNTEKYTVAQLAVFLAGCALWVVAYVAVLIHVRQQRFVVIPAAAVVANISWEWLWGFVFVPDMGLAVHWGYRIWALLDVFILVSLYRYGRKQLLTPTGQQYFPHAVTFGVLAWCTSLYFFVREGYDMSMGATSAYIINVMMSAVYIVMVVKRPEIRRFSFTVAWTKALGTALISVFMWMAVITRHPGTTAFEGAPTVADALLHPVAPPGDVTSRGFLLALCVISFLLDVLFVAGFWMRIRSVQLVEPRAEPVPARAV